MRTPVHARLPCFLAAGWLALAVYPSAAQFPAFRVVPDGTNGMVPSILKPEPPKPASTNPPPPRMKPVPAAAGGYSRRIEAQPAKPAARPAPSRTAASRTASAATNEAAATAPTPEPPAWAAEVGKKLEESLAQLESTRQSIAAERVPLAQSLDKLENELIEARKEYETVKRQLDGRNLDLNNLRNEIKAREQEKSYLSSLLSEYIRNLETRLHIIELTRYAEAIKAAGLATENSSLKPAEVFAEQVKVVDLSLQRLDGLIGGDRFAARAAGEDGLVKNGACVLLGPVAFFASDDGALVGIAEQRIGSIEPSIEGFQDPGHVPFVRDLVQNGWGEMPFDGSLGMARKVELTEETVVEHFLKGGAVMWPILGVAVFAGLIALFKWISLSAVRSPSVRQVARLIEAVGRNDHAAAIEAARTMKGPSGAMLRTGVEHLGQSKELIEEVMFEHMLDARFRFQKLLPFLAVSAASAPLLGLLGTVTGIITTFKLLTVFGSGDIKMLSGGISEALITTEYGLYVAIPALLAHSMLSRKAKALADRMERLAISLLGEVEKARARSPAS